MSGGSKSKSQQQSSSQQQSASGSGQAWANPYAQQAVKTFMDDYTALKPQMQAQSQQASQLGSQLLTDWGGAKGNAAGANATAAGGVGYTNDVLAGKYLNGNPFLNQIIATNRGDISDQVNSQFTQAGRYGSGGHTGVLADSLAEMENQLRFNNYATERGFMQEAAGQKSGEQQAAAGRAQQAEQAGLQAAMQQQQLASQIPYTGMNNLANALGALFSGGTSSGTSKASGTSTSKQSGDLLGSLGNMGLSAALAFSDPRLKHNVIPLFAEPDGLGWYEFSYLGSNERDTGVMADQVETLRPWALGPVTEGYRTVNYEMLEAA